MPRFGGNIGNCEQIHREGNGKVTHGGTERPFCRIRDRRFHTFFSHIDASIWRPVAILTSNGATRRSRPVESVEPVLERNLTITRGRPVSRCATNVRT